METNRHPIGEERCDPIAEQPLVPDIVHGLGNGVLLYLCRAEGFMLACDLLKRVHCAHDIFQFLTGDIRGAEIFIGVLYSPDFIHPLNYLLRG